MPAGLWPCILTFICVLLGLLLPSTRVMPRAIQQVLKEEALKREKEETLRQITKKKAKEVERKAAELSFAPTKAQATAAASPIAPAAAAIVVCLRMLLLLLLRVARGGIGGTWLEGEVMVLRRRRPSEYGGGVEEG
ncbi:unnamed protein product [Closterium sp. NIES-53]